jgi:outer membrane protein OmpA-like peptidoglycan-associated protein
MKNRARWATTAIMLAGATIIISGCSYVPEWANPVQWYDDLFTDDGTAFIEAPHEAGKGGFSAVADVSGAPPPAAVPAEREALAEGFAGDRENARYLEQQLREGGAPGAAEVVAAVMPSPPPMNALTLQPPAVSVKVVEVAQLAAPAPVVPALSAKGLANLGVPELAVPLPPGAAAAGLAVIADAAPLPDLRAGGLTPLLPALPPGGAVALAEPIPAPTLNPALAPARLPAPALANAAPALFPAIQPALAMPQLVAGTPAPAAAFVGAQLSVPTLKQVAQVLPPAVAAGQNTLGATFAQMLQQSQATVLIVPEVARFPTAPSPEIARPEFNLGVGVPELDTPVAPPVVQLGGFGFAPVFDAEPTVVMFGHGATVLSSAARIQIKAIADLYKANGGTIRIIGHASQRTKDMATDAHLRVNFRVSADRAVTVAVELMRLGVDPAALIIDAVSDVQPMSLEAMPSGEAKNRRVEIFLQA